MVFVPFIQIDNHRKCVTLGVGLLNDKTIESYTWLPKAFGVQPQIILTNQDNAMKKAAATVLTKSNHILYMWHITLKIAIECMM